MGGGAADSPARSRLPIVATASLPRCALVAHHPACAVLVSDGHRHDRPHRHRGTSVAAAPPLACRRDHITTRTTNHRSAVAAALGEYIPGNSRLGRLTNPPAPSYKHRQPEQPAPRSTGPASRDPLDLSSSRGDGSCRVPRRPGSPQLPCSVQRAGPVPVSRDLSQHDGIRDSHTDARTPPPLTVRPTEGADTASYPHPATGS